MTFKNIQKTHLIKAIEKIDIEGIPKDGNSQYYDVVFNKRRYPPKLIVSYANFFAHGEVLDRATFGGGKNTPCFKLLEKNGFKIVEKIHQYSQKKVWIEKTLTHNRPDRLEGERALGKALWSPQKDKRGANIYKNMLLVRKGDIILHLTDNQEITGVSIVKNEAIKSSGIKGTAWDSPSYLIQLEKFILLEPPIKRDSILSNKNRDRLIHIKKKSEVFFTDKLTLRQGAYLTPCPDDLSLLINEIYNQSAETNLPFMELETEEKNNTVFNINTLKTDLNRAGLSITEKLISRFIISLLTKPFVILTGLSGSGKTKLAQAFAKWISEDENQYCILPVGADWTNREPLLGFPNSLEKEEYVKPENNVLDLIIGANKSPEKPYFLILDEMNLSHVERYFADFLSVMESNSTIQLHSGKTDWSEVPNQLILPANLFVIGTVNIDETTYMFSPKVLDRANVIEFRVTSEEMEVFLNDNKTLDLSSITGLGSATSFQFLEIAKNKNIKPSDSKQVIVALNMFFKELKKVGAEFGYRSASEILRFASIVNNTNADWSINEIIDVAILQKLLPKVHGSRRKLEPVLKTLAELCLMDNNDIGEFMKYKSEIDLDDPRINYPLSLEKILRMYENLLSNGFTSYAEA